MKKCCETCKFFAKGALAGSGWCRHPERVDVNNDLVLVRASQLTCRRGWDQDSWEPIDRTSRSNGRFPRDAQIGPVPPVSQADFNAIINADRNSSSTGAQVALAEKDEDRVVDTSPAPLPRVPNSLIAKQLPAAPEPMVAEADHVMEEKWMRAAKEDVKKARISNRVRPMVPPLPSQASDIDAATPRSSPDPAPPVDPLPALPEERPTTTPENVRAADYDAAIPERPAPVSVEPTAPSAPIAPPAPIDFETGIERDPREPLIPSILPAFDHQHYVEERPTRTLWLVPRGTPEYVEIPERPQLPRYLLDSVDDDIVVSSNMLIDNRPFELPPIVESFRPFVAQEVEEIERPRQKPRRKRPSATAFGSRWSAARERPDTELVAGDDVSLATGAGVHGRGHSERSFGADIDWQDSATAADAETSVETEHDDTWEESVEPLHVEATTDSEIVPTAESDVLLTGSAPDWEIDDAIVHVAAELTFDSRSPIYGTDFSVGDDIVVRDIGAGPLAYDSAMDQYVIAPEVPRMCRTCSSFRPADDGERGWCGNAWAFDNKQMVSAFELPCASSFGTWWIPVDAAWQDPELERRDAPTPLYDRLMAMKPQTRKERTFNRKRWS